MDEKRKKHCWECLRRRLVCDSTRSGCKRCSASGVPCPGYGETKPSRLKWLAPGRVTSQNRRAKDAVSYGLQDDNSDSVTDVGSLIIVPRFQMRTEQCDLAQAIGYCKFCERWHNGPRDSLKHRQLLHISRPSSRTGVGAKSTHIPYHY
jgi:hypothetical protein